MITVKTFFNEAKTPADAKTQINIIARAETLFKDGYEFEELLGHRDCGMMKTPEGTYYGVDSTLNICSCEAHKKYGDCKHRIAVAQNISDEDDYYDKMAEEAEYADRF